MNQQAFCKTQPLCHSEMKRGVLWRIHQSVLPPVEMTKTVFQRILKEV